MMAFVIPYNSFWISEIYSTTIFLADVRAHHILWFHYSIRTRYVRYTKSTHFHSLNIPIVCTKFLSDSLFHRTVALRIWKLRFTIHYNWDFFKSRVICSPHYISSKYEPFSHSLYIFTVKIFSNLLPWVTIRLYSEKI